MSLVQGRDSFPCPVFLFIRNCLPHEAGTNFRRFPNRDSDLKRLRRAGVFWLWRDLEHRTSSRLEGVFPVNLNSEVEVEGVVLANVAAGIPACRKAGLPSPADKNSRPIRRLEILPAADNRARFFRAAGCRPPRQAGMPDVTQLRNSGSNLPRRCSALRSGKLCHHRFFAAF